MPTESHPDAGSGARSDGCGTGGEGAGGHRPETASCAVPEATPHADAPRSGASHGDVPHRDAPRSTTSEVGSDVPSESAGPQRRRVTIVPGGPMLVEGPLELCLPDGRTVTSDRFQVAVCACRRSAAYPFCDTSHRRRR